MYENLSIVYDKLMDVDYDTYANIIAQELGDKKDLLILDLGCGSGTMIPYLKKYGQVFAVDNSEQMLSIASSKSPDNNFFAMDLLEISNLGYEFDFILSAFDVFNYLLDFDNFKNGLKEVYSSLKTDGKFIFDIHTPKKMRDMIDNLPPKAYHSYTSSVGDNNTRTAIADNLNKRYGTNSARYSAPYTLSALPAPINSSELMRTVIIFATSTIAGIINAPNAPYVTTLYAVRLV